MLIIFRIIICLLLSHKISLTYCDKIWCDFSLYHQSICYTIFFVWLNKNREVIFFEYLIICFNHAIFYGQIVRNYAKKVDYSIQPHSGYLLSDCAERKAHAFHKICSYNHAISTIQIVINFSRAIFIQLHKKLFLKVCSFSLFLLKAIYEIRMIWI